VYSSIKIMITILTFLMAGLKNGVERDVTEVCWVLSISTYTPHQKDSYYCILGMLLAELATRVIR
jgi:hypothetical protein